ncbi:hypothetical protein AAHA92_18083 [Salvia divinorum]|uniref:Uncharacterized protein n=1 Tax=Salvia divinorum TaxID=28513 RepID=A0ABD1H3R8_SALDI
MVDLSTNQVILKGSLDQGLYRFCLHKPPKHLNSKPTVLPAFNKPSSGLPTVCSAPVGTDNRQRLYKICTFMWEVVGEIVVALVSNNIILGDSGSNRALAKLLLVLPVRPAGLDVVVKTFLVRGRPTIAGSDPPLITNHPV